MHQNFSTDGPFLFIQYLRIIIIAIRQRDCSVSHGIVCNLDGSSGNCHGLEYEAWGLGLFVCFFLFLFINNFQRFVKLFPKHSYCLMVSGHMLVVLHAFQITPTLLVYLKPVHFDRCLVKIRGILNFNIFVVLVIFTNFNLT